MTYETQSSPLAGQQLTERRRMTTRLVADLRLRLLDLSNRNRLLNATFSDRGSNHVRAIDEIPDILHQKLVDGKALSFCALPEPPDEPHDERSGRFQKELNAARVSDTDYLEAIAQLQEEDEGSAKVARIERGLKDRIRQRLGLPPRPNRENRTPAEQARISGMDPSFDLPRSISIGTQKPGYADNLVQTLLYPDQLARKLSRIYHGVQTALSEMGVNTLHAAFGYLEWYESDSSDKRLFAPLLLHSLVMDRTLVNNEYRFKVTSSWDASSSDEASQDEASTTNLTLRERLRRDFALELPKLNRDESPEQYFSRVDTLIKNQKRWRVRRFVTIGIVAFDRLVMYQDLAPDNWPDDRPLDAHPILVELLAGAERSGSPFAEDYDTDLPQVAGKVPLLIADADSSQFSAIVDVMDGKNLAIKGPPGTGKSQTITNIIAAALAQGKTVLFIAEKTAALEVVKSRLDHVGLGDFCLELHSTKTRKAEVIASLKKRLDRRPQPLPASLADAINEQEQLRAQLTRYADLINQPFEDTGKTLHDLFWAAVRARERKDHLALPVTLDRTLLEGSTGYSSFYADRSRAALDALQKAAATLAPIGNPECHHPWAGVRAAGLSPFEQERFVDALRAWRESLSTICDLVLAAETNLDVARPSDAQDGDAIIRAIDLLPDDTSSVDLELLPRMVDEEVREGIRQFVDSVRRWDETNKRVLEKMAVPLAPQPVRVATLESDYRALSGNFPQTALTVGGLQQFADQCSTVEHQALAQMPTIARLLELAGMQSSATTRKVGALLRAVDLLRATPREILQKRSPRLHEPTSQAILNQAQHVAHDLCEQRTNLANRFSFNDDTNPQDCRALASALRSGGRFSRLFSRDFKQAQKAWQRMYKGIGHVASSDMALGLQDIATHLESARAFTADERLKSICGAEFHGLETNFDFLLSVNAFAKSVHEWFALEGSGYHQIPTLLLEANYSQIEAVLSLVTQPVADSLKALLATLETSKAVNDNTELGEIIKHFGQSASAARELCRSIIDSGIRSELPLEALKYLASDVQEEARLRSDVEGAETAKSLLGEKFRGVLTDVSRLVATAELAEAFVGGGWSEALVSPMLSRNLVAKHPALKTFARSFRDSLAREAAAQSAASSICNVADAHFFSQGHTAFQAKADRIQLALEHEDALPSWAEYCQLRVAVEGLGLVSILEAYDMLDAPYQLLAEAFDFVFYHSLLRSAYRQYPELARFSGIGQEEARRRFQAADRTITRLRTEKLAADLSRNPIPWGNGGGRKSTWTERHLLQNEIPKRTKHIPLRDLLQRAGKAVQSLKPCWMMSPASVAQFVRPDGVQFDIIVIDEASQMKPEDALGAAARGKQLIVVGDPQQLPPTSFFERAQADVGGADDASADSIDTESILDLALNVFESPRDLRWHYRSRHESLIAFSNMEFYDRGLIVFPSPFKPGRDYGVSYQKVDGIYVPKAGINVVEAQTVANAAAVFMRDPNNRDRSLGIVAVNQAQRDILLEEMSRIYATEPATESYRNLESVQGDERDVIFVSTVYGPDQLGGRVAQRFGPINAAAGHRRLNVLFTRAKEKVVVFSSMDASDVVPTETSRRGVTVLKNYLSYAQHGSLGAAVTSGREPDSDFEEFVARRLKQQGYGVVTQLGVDGYFIDMALKDPRNTDRFLLGIECDGKTYHSAKSARDRDRLREEILQQKGWQLYRIWSTDWFSDPERETRKLIAHVKSLMDKPHSEVRRSAEFTHMDSSSRPGNGSSMVVSQYAALPISGFGANESEVGAKNASTAGSNSSNLEPYQRRDEPQQQPKDDRLDRLAAKTRVPTAQLAILTATQLDALYEEYCIAASTAEASARTDPPTPQSHGNNPPPQPQSHVLVEILRQRGLQIIDNRSKWGVLWVIGGRELSWLNREFSYLGAQFRYAPTGSQATKHKAAWFTRSPS